MITTGLLDFVLLLLGAALGSTSFGAPPAWATSAGSFVGTVFSAANSMGVWFPSGLVVTVILAIIAVRSIGLVLKLARMVLSLFTGGGGNAT